MEMQWRQISTRQVLEVVQSPQQKLPSRGQRWVHQSQYFDTIMERVVILRVIVEVRGEDIYVVTAYKTTRVEKYWVERQP